MADPKGDECVEISYEKVYLTNKAFLTFKIFTYLAELGLSCSMRDLVP